MPALYPLCTDYPNYIRMTDYVIASKVIRATSEWSKDRNMSIRLSPMRCTRRLMFIA